MQTVAKAEGFTGSLQGLCIHPRTRINDRNADAFASARPENRFSASQGQYASGFHYVYSISSKIEGFNASSRVSCII
jgi:hypothetical protein